MAITSGLGDARVLVTRPVRQAEGLSRLIAGHGGEAVRFPTLEIVAHAPDPQVLALVRSCDWLIFTSTNAVDFAIRVFGGKMPAGSPPKIAAIGAATAGALRQAGRAPDCLPATEFSSEGLLAEAQLQDVTGSTCVIVRGAGGRETLARMLTAAGARTHYLEVYRRCRPDADAAALSARIRGGGLDAVTATSGEALHNLLVMLEPEAVVCLKTLPLVVVSARMAEMAGALGFQDVAVSRQATDAAILQTLTTLFNGENSGRSNRRRTRNPSSQAGG